MSDKKIETAKKQIKYYESLEEHGVANVEFTTVNKEALNLYVKSPKAIEEIKEIIKSIQNLALNYTHPDHPDVAEWGAVYSGVGDIDEILKELENV